MSKGLGLNMISRKRCMLWCVLLIGCMLMTACSQKAPPLILPDPSNVELVEIITEEKRSQQTDREWISAVMESLLASTPTSKPSVQDSPLLDSYVQMNFHLREGVNTLYLYQEGQRYYAERPYHGIYEIDAALYENICDAQN